MTGLDVTPIDYVSGGTAMRGALVHAKGLTGQHPLLLVSPNWLSVTPASIERAGMLAGDRYVAFVADMYGEGRIAAGPPEAAPLANALRADAPERRRRIAAAFDAMTAAATTRGVGDASRRAALGFCFGGGNVLELARTGADLAAVISLHGDLTSAMQAAPGTIRARLMVLHGAADPVAPKAERDAFEAEMTAAGADWQMLAFGGVVHSFAEDEPGMPGVAEYHSKAARQSYRMVADFLEDAFADRL